MPGPATYDPLRDGYATLITLSLRPAIKLYEREVTPPALVGGGKIESTHMRRSVWRMQDPKTLKGLGDLVATVMYAVPAYGNDIMADLNTIQVITVRWPNNATLAFYGWVDNFAPSGHSEGNLPTAVITIIPALYNNTTGAEAGPLYTP
jgi:hypothetical protein